jgi:hypothetical protein
MTTYANKEEILIREKLNELDKKITPAGYDLMRAESRHDQHVLLGIGRKNIIINGDMRIAQRDTSVAGLTTQPFTTVDRFGYNMFNNGSCQRTDSQESTGGPPGFPYSKKMLFTTSQTTNNNSRNQIRYMVEGYDMGGLSWGTDKAKDVTLSFWAKSNVTGYHAVSVINQSETHTFISDYSIPTKDEWHHIKITIPGPNVASWNDNEAIGIRLAWDMGSGDDYNISTSQRDMWLTAWKYRSPYSVRVAEVPNAYFQLTGVQLEVGREATPFEHRSYGEELALCQRYFERYYPAAQMQIYNESSTSNHKWIRLIHAIKRSAPSLAGSSGIIGLSNGGIGTISSLTRQGGSVKEMSIRVGMNQSTGTPNAIYHVDPVAGSAYFDLYSEL